MNDIQYTQQHLANERTYLAWIRTVITIVGLGFLASGVIYKGYSEVHKEYFIAAFVGISSILLACLILILATINYLRKQKNISKGIFITSNSLVYVVLTGLIVLSLSLLILVVLMIIQ